MRCALFGKLPSKRDFVALGMERPFLDLWENWLQAGVALSRDSMGATWQEAFLRAPIWRFWIGSRIAGTTTAGALMPSVDKVGRYFPLSLCASAPAGTRIEPPPHDGIEQWLSWAEQFLLRMLDDELTADLSELVATAPVPPIIANEVSTTPMTGGSGMTAHTGDLALLFRSLATEDHETLYGGRSYWWTAGGADHPPKLLVAQGMPGPALFSMMLGAQHNMAQSA